MIRLSLFLLLMGSSLALAENFVAPEAYPVSRYEAGWQKNPFTLKTAPVVMQQESFARDLALGGISKIAGVTKVVVLNVKTHARIPLTGSEVSQAGISVKAVHLADTRKETFVELASGGQTAVVRYDENVLKQLAATNPTGKTGAGVMQLNPNGAPPGAPGAQNPPMPMQGGALPMPTNPAQANINNANGAMVSSALRSGTSPPQSVIPSPTRRRLNNLPLPIVPPAK
jgi:hypothetical protein